MTEFSWYMTIQLPNRSEFSGTSQGRGARSKPELLRTCIAKSEGRERVEFTLPAKARFDLNQVLRNRGAPYSSTTAISPITTDSRMRTRPVLPPSGLMTCWRTLTAKCRLRKTEAGAAGRGPEGELGCASYIRNSVYSVRIVVTHSSVSVI